MRKVTVVLIVLLTFHFCKAQWVQQTTSSGWHSRISFLNNNTGFVCVGSPGLLFKTSNGGDNWNVVFSDGSDEYFTGISILSDSLIYSTTLHAVLKSTNAGSNWVKYTYPSDYRVNDISFSSANTGYCVGDGKVSKSTNGGVNWFRLNSPIPSFGFTQVLALDENIVFVLGSNISPNIGYLLRTTDGGLTWTNLYIHDGGPSDIYFINSFTGYVCGEKLLKTTNKGLDWDTLGPAPASRICFTSTSTGYAASTYYTQTYYNKVYKTTNYGNNWAEITPAFHMGYAQDIYFVNDSVGWFLSNFNIQKTTNGGSTFINNNSNQIPSNFILYQNYPNPFNPSTKINYELKTPADIALNIYDANGRLIKILESGFKQAGNYETNFSAEGLSSGVYYYSLHADGVLMDTKKALILK